MIAAVEAVLEEGGEGDAVGLGAEVLGGVGVGSESTLAQQEDKALNEGASRRERGVTARGSRGWEAVGDFLVMLGGFQQFPQGSKVVIGEGAALPEEGLDGPIEDLDKGLGLALV